MATTLDTHFRIAFIGTVEFSWHCLDEVLSMGANVVLAAYVDPAEAGAISDYRPLDDLCRSHGVPWVTFRRIRDAAPRAAVAAAKPDLIFVLGLSQLLPESMLTLPPAGVVGSHPALLPENRGRALIPWSILLHHERGGLTLFYLTPEVDAGDIIAQAAWPLTREDTATTVYRKMVAAGRQLIREYLPALTRGTAPRIPQDHSKATYLPRRTPADGRIDWAKSAEEVYDLIRATTHPYPGAFTFLNGRRLICWSAHTGGSGFDVRSSMFDVWTVVPGTVLVVSGGSALVSCGQGAVWLDAVDAGPGEVAAGALLAPGARLGLSR